MCGILTVKFNGSIGVAKRVLCNASVFPVVIRFDVHYRQLRLDIKLIIRQGSLSRKRHLRTCILYAGQTCVHEGDHGLPIDPLDVEV